MSESCPRCKSEYAVNLTECPKCKLLNLNIANWIPDDLKKEYISKWKIQKTTVTKKFIKNLFKKLLKKYNQRPHTIEIKTTNDAVLEIFSNDDYHKRIELRFNPLILSYYSEEDIILQMYYQIFLLLTMKSSKIRVPEVSEELMDYLTDFTVMYNAYLAHTKFSSFYENNEAFSKLKKRTLTNFPLQIYNLQHSMKTGDIKNPLVPLIFLNKIFQDALYFLIYEKELLRTNGETYNYNSIIKIFNWLIEDLEIIHQANPSTSKMFDITQLMGYLLMSVDPIFLILKDAIIFDVNTNSKYNKIRKKTNNEIGQKIITNWEKRFSEYKEASEKHFRTMDEKIEELKSDLKLLNPVEILNYVTLISAIPGNEVFGVRFEFVFKLIISIPQSEFSNEKLEDKHIQNIFEKLSDFGWDMFEDYEPTRTLDYPPIWILGNRYQLLSGVQLRAYENWKDIVSDFFPLQDEFEAKFRYNPISAIKDALSLQTELLEYLKDEKFQRDKIENIFVPH